MHNFYIMQKLWRNYVEIMQILYFLGAVVWDLPDFESIDMLYVVYLLNFEGIKILIKSKKKEGPSEGFGR